MKDFRPADRAPERELTQVGSPRHQMVKSAALLIRQLGAHPTAIADVLQHSRAPRGSTYHYFPGGRTQIICEAVDYSRDYISNVIQAASSSADAIDAFIGDYRQHLASSGYRAGCPIAAVVVDAGGPDATKNTTPAIEHAAAAFDQWTTLIANHLVTDGVAPSRARDFAIVATASVEGAVVLARARRNVEPLDIIHRWLRDGVDTLVNSADGADSSRPARSLP